MEAFFEDTGRILVKGFNGGVARTGIHLEADNQGGKLTLFDGNPTGVPNTINQTVYLDGRAGPRGGKLILRDGLRSDSVIELSGYDPLVPVEVATIRLKGALLVQRDGALGGYIEADQLLLSHYLQLDLTSGAPPSGDCNATEERGRMKFDATTASLWICAVSGWVAK
jgi:hypothetical protein